MNWIQWIAPGRLLLVGALAAALVFGVPLIVGRYNDGLREEGRQEVREAGRIAAEAQAARNRELQRAAELRYTVTAAARDRFFVQTVKEVHHAAAPLAACPVPEPVRVRLNAAAGCVRDPEAPCGVLDGVSGP